MKFPSKEELALLRKTYVPGTVVELTSDMADPYHSLPAGLRGEVTGVDDAGNIQMRWSNGSSLALIPGGRLSENSVLGHSIKDRTLCHRRDYAS